MKIISEEITNELWDMIYIKFKFNPGISNNEEDWISIPCDNKIYMLNNVWTKEQESMINTFFEKLVNGEMFALDWQHDCFTFSPEEHIPFQYEYHDSERDCQVYFPTYYPNGDYYFFFDKEWRYGLLGHPWRKEIIVIGKELIDMFWENKDILNIA